MIQTTAQDIDLKPWVLMTLTKANQANQEVKTGNLAEVWISGHLLHASGYSGYGVAVQIHFPTIRREDMKSRLLWRTY